MKQDWYPNAKIIPHKDGERRMRCRGEYPKKWPYGAVVHHTAGRDGAEKTIRGGRAQGYTYVCIQKDGTIYQDHPVSQWGYHAGESAWKNPSFAKKLLGSVSDDLIGIEINNAGKLTEVNGECYAWWDMNGKTPKAGAKPIPIENRRYTPGFENMQRGWYERFTLAQEKTLKEFLLWLYRQAPDVFSFDLVLGHDEVAGPLGIGYFRKNDPGASLSTPMSGLRKELKSLVSPGVISNNLS